MYGRSFKLDPGSLAADAGPGRLAADAGPECTAAASSLIQDVWQLMQVQNVRQQL